MKNQTTAGFFTFFLLLALPQFCSAQNRPADFSARWMLDKDKTLFIPPSLESYTLSVTQDSRWITIETDLHNGIEPVRISKASTIAGPNAGLGGFSLPKEVIVGMALRLKTSKVA